MKLVRGIWIISVVLGGCSATIAEPEGSPTPGSSTPVTAASTATSPSITVGASTAPVQETGAETAPSPSSSVLKKYLEADKLQNTFGFADTEGQHILVTREDDSEIENMISLNTALGNNGQTLAVTFERWQPGGENSTGRESAHNFANLQGYVYKVDGGSAAPDETYYLANSAEFKMQALLTVHPAQSDRAKLNADEAARKRIAAAKQREVKAAWKLADLPPGRGLYLVQFVRQDNNMLFSLIVEDGGQLMFMDYPAVIQGDEYSVWRVDDGGEVMPEMFSLLFAAETENGLLLGLNWWGAEGVNSFFLSQDGDSFKELDIHYGRYTSPL